MKRLVTLMEPWLIEEKDHSEYEKVIELYFNMITYMKMSELYDEHYITSIEVIDRDMILKLYCVDSSFFCLVKH